MAMKVELAPERHTTTRLDWIWLAVLSAMAEAVDVTVFSDSEGSSPRTLQATSAKEQFRHYSVTLLRLLDQIIARPISLEQRSS
jgi:hypothetical protein